MHVATHDPGGKVRTALPAGLRGDAEFSPTKQRRVLLRRWVGDDFPARFLLLIGMNPSVASAEFNDPTITREWGFAAREGYTGLAKCNLGDWRATNPKDLPVDACSGRNLAVIKHQAALAERVVVCWGKVPKPLQEPAIKVLSALSDMGVSPWCFGQNKDGSPKHPLYLAASTPLVRFIH